MYIPYEEIGAGLYNILKNDKLKEFFYNLKISQNLCYIEHNKLNVIKKLHHKLENKEKIDVVFYVYDLTKWKCQSVYELIDSDERFNVNILVTKSAAKNTDNPTYQSIKDVKRTYTFFKSKGMKVQLAYDIKKNKFIPFKKFNPDIIIYQHPWYVETTQGPVVCSKFALTYYVPYFVANAGLKEDYYLRFHSYVEKHCVLNQSILDYFSSKMLNKGKNLIATGHPQLDYFILNQRNEDDDNKYIIYAPHWTICSQGLAYGTFQWNGKFILDYAKKHPDLCWVFKPHPLLRKALEDTGYMKANEVQDYYNQWDKIGIKCEASDYMTLFSSSKCMITDSGSFLTEYFLTKKPLIHIISDTKHEYCPHYKIITDNYYEAKNLEGLKYLLDEIILNDNDIMKEKREHSVEISGFYNVYSAQKIVDNIIQTIVN